MKNNNRIKINLPTLTSRDDAEACMNNLACVVNNQRQALARRDADILAINDEFAPELAHYDETIKHLTDQLRHWAEANPDQFPKDRKSLKLVSGILGFRTGTPKLALLSRAWSWDKVLAAIASIKEMAEMFIRTKQEVDKEAIIGVYNPIVTTPVAQDELRRIGVKIVQDESFFAEPDLTQFDTRQTQPASN